MLMYVAPTASVLPAAGWAHACHSNNCSWQQVSQVLLHIYIRSMQQVRKKKKEVTCMHAGACVMSEQSMLTCMQINHDHPSTSSSKYTYVVQRHRSSIIGRTLVSKTRGCGFESRRAWLPTSFPGRYVHPDRRGSQCMQASVD